MNIVNKIENCKDSIKEYKNFIKIYNNMISSLTNEIHKLENTNSNFEIIIKYKNNKEENKIYNNITLNELNNIINNMLNNTEGFFSIYNKGYPNICFKDNDIKNNIENIIYKEIS